MREANDRGYDCLLVEDATESYFPEFKAATLEMIRAQGAIVGWTASTDKVLEGLVHKRRRAGAAGARACNALFDHLVGALLESKARRGRAPWRS